MNNMTSVGPVGILRFS